MKIRNKLILTFTAFTFIVAAVGILGLIATIEITKSFDGGEEHFRSIVSASTEVSSYVKRAEGHLMLYLTLHDVNDRELFFSRFEAMQEEIALLDSIIGMHEARDIFEKIKFNADELLPVGRSLIEIHDNEMKEKGSFIADNHMGLIRSLNDHADSVRKNALDLAHYETDFLNRQEAITAATELSNYVQMAENHLITYTVLHEKRDLGYFFMRFASLREQLSILDTRLRDADEKSMLTRIRGRVNQLMPVARTLIEVHDNEMAASETFNPDNHAKLFRTLNSIVSSIRKEGIELAQINVMHESQAKAAATKKAAYIRRIVITAIIASILIALIGTYFFSKTFSNPLLRLRELASRIGRGHLATPIDIDSKDEIGDLAASFKTMTSNLQKSMVSRDYMNNIIKSMMDSLIVVDLQGTITAVNPALCKMLFYREEDLVGISLRQIFGGYDSPGTDITHYINTLHANDRETQYISKNGAIIPVLLSASLIYGPSGNPEGAVYVAHDITDLKQAELSLKASEKNYRDLVDTAPVGVYKTNIEGKFMYGNDALLDIFEFSSLEELRRDNVESRYVHPDDRKRLISILKEKGVIRNFETELITKNRRHKNVLLSGTLYGDVISGMMIDITEKINFQKEAMQAGYLASLGELAAGVAHEINNPVNGILNYAQILLNESKKDSREQDILTRIIRESDRVAVIVSGLLSFARGRLEKKSPIHVSDIMSASLDLTSSHIVRDGIRFKLDIPPDLPAIYAHSQQIQQVFLNIISNARYALNQKYNGRQDDKYLEIIGRQIMVDSHPYVRVSFFDNGNGIPDSLLDKVKKPFVSTKPKGEGTGLGLSISHGIVSEHGGRLVIDSIDGEYTKVMIDLPVNAQVS
jgi:PAS domain S-box-containing protein